MPRDIKGFEFRERLRNDWEVFKAVKLYIGIYREEDLKIHYMTNQFGQTYTDIYVRIEAQPKAELAGMFGSAMTFKDKGTGVLSGDKIFITK